MARGINKCIFVGNLGHDPDIADANGTKVANFNIAVNEQWKDREGEKQERVEWVRCVAFAGLADVAEQYLRKGGKVYVEGRWQTRKWEDKEGIERYSTECVLHQLVMLGGRGEGGGSNVKASQQAEAAGYSKPDHAAAAAGDDDDEDDDVPF